MFRFRPLLALLFVAVTLASVAPSADAAPRISAGSRGARTFSEPPPTATAPNVARPIERTMTQPSTAVRPVAPVAPNGGFLNRPGLLGGFAAGFLGAGLFGMLFGSGIVGGLGGMASFFGLLLQIGLLVIVSTVAWRWWQRRSQAAASGRPAPYQLRLWTWRHSFSRACAPLRPRPSPLALGFTRRVPGPHG